MRVGLHALGIGTGARPEVIRAVAVAAEAAGFATLWWGEHVVLVDRPASRYPYSADGRIAVPADADWLDPLLGLSYAAAVTTRIGLATGVLLLPEHNPVLAGQAGRDAGRAVRRAVHARRRHRLVGGGVRGARGPVRRRGAGAPPSTSRRCARSGPTTSPRSTASSPASRRSGSTPSRSAAGGSRSSLGGNSDAALRRAAAFGDGWYGFNLPWTRRSSGSRRWPGSARRRGRDPAELTIAVALTDGDPGHAARPGRGRRDRTGPGRRSPGGPGRGPALGHRPGRPLAASTRPLTAAFTARRPPRGSRAPAARGPGTGGPAAAGRRRPARSTAPG